MIIRNCLTNNTVLDKFHTHLFKVANFNINNIVRQTEFRNTIFQHTTNLVKCFKHSHIITQFSHIASKRQTTRTRTYNRNLNSVRSSHLRHSHLTTITFIISSKTFKITNSHCRLTSFCMNTFAFTLTLLRTHTTTHSWQCRCLFQHLSCLKNFTTFNIFNKSRNINAHRATLHTRWIRTVKTTFCLQQSLLHSETLVHLFRIFATIFTIQLIHLHALNSHTLFWFHSSAQLFAPNLISSFHIIF